MSLRKRRVLVTLKDILRAAREMRLPIFWRTISAHLCLIALVLVASIYALQRLNRLATLSAEMFVTNSARIEAEQRLLAIFLAQMRRAEKYLVLQDAVFYEHFTQGSQDFEKTLSHLLVLADTAEEEEVIGQLWDLHGRYAAGLATVQSGNTSWEREQAALNDAMSARIHDLVRLREEAVTRKTTAIYDRAARAAELASWLTLGGISIAMLLAYVNARGISRPLKLLAHELRLVGTGEFNRSLNLRRAPGEVAELTHAFNWMAHRLAELDEMKADFVAHVSHDLRTPLTAIQEGTALLLEEIPGPLSSAQREVLTVVRNHGERLFHSLSSLLDLSKMEAGMMEYVWSPTDLGGLIGRSVETVQLIAQKKHIQLTTSCPSALPLVWCDERRIQQVLDNLLSNAVKFTPDGGTVAVAAVVDEDPSGQTPQVVVRVADTGAGIPADEREKVFTKFYQSERRRTEHQRGTGLGLAIARHIIDAHGGKIWVESEPGEGAAFVFTLPVGGAAQDQIKTETLALPDGVEHAV